MFPRTVYGFRPDFAVIQACGLTNASGISEVKTPLFFTEAYSHGANMVMTSEVYAQEIVLQDKHNVRWLVRRSFRGGVCRSVLRLIGRGRVFYVASGLSQALAYGLLSILLIWRQRAATRQFLRAAKSAGILWGALGRDFRRISRSRREVAGRVRVSGSGLLRYARFS